MLCTETREKKSIGAIVYCVLKQERNRSWVIYSVVYRNRREIESDDIECFALKQERNKAGVICSVVY